MEGFDLVPLCVDFQWLCDQQWQHTKKITSIYLTLNIWIFTQSYTKASMSAKYNIVQE